MSVTRPGRTPAVLGRRQPRAVAALLVSERRRAVARSEIAEALWGEDLPEHWAGAVRGVVSKVRTFLDGCDAGSWLVSTVDGWRIELPEGVEVDVEIAAAAVDAAEAALRDGGADGAGAPDPTGALEEVVAATRALAADLAPGAEGIWVEDRRAELARLRIRALAAGAALAGRSGRHEVAVDAARELVEADPYSDAAARTLVAALAAAGDRAGALRAFDDFDRRLRHDVGVDPEDETAALARRIRGLTAPAPSAPLAGGARSGGPLVGRVEELAVLRRAWDAVAAGGRARAVLLTGEPGSGKTRLAVEASGWVDRGRVLWGRCSPERRISFEPVVEALARTFADDRTPLDALGPLAVELGPILPELADGSSGDGTDRAPLFRAVTGAVRMSVTAPSVWVVDDVHWADGDTIALVDHVVGGITDVDVLVVLTSRGHDAAVAAMLSEVARRIPLETIALGGLDVDAVTDLLAGSGVHDPDALGELVRERTGGNPFFIGELVRSADGDGRMDPGLLPPTLRSWIDQRVAALDPGPAEALRAAAVLGAQVDLEVLARVVDVPPREALQRCRPLVDGGLLVEVSGGDADLAFAHALTREAVHDGLGPAERRLLHQEAATALRTVRPNGPAAEVAGHLAAAGPGADAEAVAAMLDAGAEALSSTAWDAAERWFAEVVGRRTGTEAERVRALIGAGQAQRGLARRDDARRSLSEALELARAAGWARLAAEATVGLVGGGARGVSESLPDPERAELLRAALDGLDTTGGEDDDLRVSLQVELALALLLTDRVEERQALADDAVDRARRLGRADLLGVALLGHRVARPGPEHAEARLADVDEVLALDGGSRPATVTIGALMSRHEDALLVGDRATARVALAQAADAAEAYGHPYWRWVVETWRVLERIIDGDLDGAEAAAFGALQHQAEHPEAMACLGVELVDVRLFQGRSGEVVDLLAGAADENPQIPCYRAVLALCRAESGDLDGAAESYRFFAADAFAAIPDDTNRLLTLGVLADVAATLEDRTGAAQLLALLEPLGSRQVLLNCFAGGGAYWGPVATQLGRLSALLGDAAAADGWFARARASAEAFDAPLALARIPD